MDLFNLSLTGLVALGTVNVIGFLKPNISSGLKFALSFLVALAVTFIPAQFSNILLENVKIALEAALAASGVYKLASKAGGLENTGER